MLLSADPLLFLFPWRFEIEIEPIFASLALYDVKEKKKVSCYAFLSASLSPELLGHFCKPLKMLGGQNEFDEWTIKILCCGPVMLAGAQLNHTLELCVYLKKFTFFFLLPFSWQTLEGSTRLDKWITHIFCSAQELYYFTSGSFVSELFNDVCQTPRARNQVAVIQPFIKKTGNTVIVYQIPEAVMLWLYCYV